MPPPAPCGTRTNESAAAEKVTFPGALTVTEGAAPDADSSRCPLAGRRVKGVFSPAHVQAAVALLSATLVTRLAVPVTVVARALSKSAIAACGMVMVIDVFIGRIG